MSIKKKGVFSGFNSFLKKLLLTFLGQGYKEHVVLCGILRGLRLYLHTETQLQVIFGLWERELTPYFKKLFKKAVWFIDVGAGRGEHVIFLLHSKKLKHVIAFEPQISEVDLFKKNLLLNGFQNDSRLEISQKFVGTSTGGGNFSFRIDSRH